MKTMVLLVQDDYEIGILAEDKDTEKLSLAVDTFSTTALPLESWAKLFELSHANVCVNGNKACAEVEELTAILIKKGLYMSIEKFLCTVEETGATPFPPSHTTTKL